MSALEMTAPEITRVNLKNIRRDGGTQPRAGIDPITVNEYTESMVAGVEFPPVTLFHDGQWYWLADGFHRVAAAEAAGLEAVRADVRSGEKRDAVLFSVGVNAHHGLRRTNPDKRRAVETLLRDEEWRQWSDREIARRVQVDHKTVAGVRAQLIQLGEIPRMEERKVERNGQTYHIKTKSSYAPGMADEADVETARQIALDILGDAPRDQIKAHLQNGDSGVMNEGIAYVIGTPDGSILNNEKVSAGQIGVLLRTANGEGVYRFDALQLVDWRDQRDTMLKDDEVLKTLLKMETKTTGWVEGKVGKKLIKFGLAVPTSGNNSTEVRITAYGRAVLARLYEQNPILGIERDVIQSLGDSSLAWQVTRGGSHRALVSLYAKQAESERGGWVHNGSITYGYMSWIHALAGTSYVRHEKRLSPRKRYDGADIDEDFFVITPEGCALIGEDPLPEPEPLPDTNYHSAAGVFVYGGEEFGVAVGDLVQTADRHDSGTRTGVVLELGAWPEIKVKDDNITWGTGEATWYDNKTQRYTPPTDSTSTQFNVGDEVLTRTGRKGIVTVVNGALVTVDVNGVATNHKRETLSHAHPEDAAEMDTQVAHVWHSLKTVETAIEQLDDVDLASDLYELLGAMQGLLADTESGQRLGLLRAMIGADAE